MTGYQVNNHAVTDALWIRIFNNQVGWRIFNREGPVLIICEENGKVSVGLNWNIWTEASFVFNAN